MGYEVQAQVAGGLVASGGAGVDSGGKHVHIIRNEGTMVATNIAVQLIPGGAMRRIDAAAAPVNSYGQKSRMD